MDRKDDIGVNARAQQLLKVLVESYIESGQPIGSKTLRAQSELSLSPATIRNVMAELEDKGYLKSPHKSAGRVPTPRGYRFFVDSLIKVEPVENGDFFHLSKRLNPDMSSHKLVQSASSLLSDVTSMAGVVT